MYLPLTNYECVSAGNFLESLHGIENFHKNIKKLTLPIIEIIQWQGYIVFVCISVFFQGFCDPFSKFPYLRGLPTWRFTNRTI